MLVCGASRCGKSEFVKSLLKNPQIWQKYPEKVTISYLANKSQYNDVPYATLVHGLPDLDEFTSNDKFETLVIDDGSALLTQKNNSLLSLFTLDSHHNNKTIIYVCHNPFMSHARTLRLQCNYLVFFPNAVDGTYIENFARQSYQREHNVFMDAFKEASSRPYGYLWYNAQPNCPRDHRLLTNIFEEPQVLYKRKHG